MAPPRVADQEFVVHCFAPLDGPRAAEAYQQVRQVWAACAAQLGMTEPIAGLPAPASLPATVAADGVVAARQSPGGDRQGILRRVHDALNLSVSMTPPVPEEVSRRSRGLRTLLRPAAAADHHGAWVEFGQAWAEVSALGTDALLAEGRLFIAKVPSEGARGVAATAELGQSLGSLLPHWRDRSRDWWRRGSTTVDGFALWDTGPVADLGSARELVLLAAADRDAELSAWAWSDGTPDIPPLGSYLLYAAKLRYEARLLQTWHQAPDAGDVDAVIAELNAAFEADAPRPEDVGLLRSRLRGLRAEDASLSDLLLAEQARLTGLQTDLERLRGTISIARGNLGIVPGGSASAGAAGMFAADQELARWLTEQVEADLNDIMTDLGQVREMRSLAAGKLSQAESAKPEPSVQGPSGGASAVPGQAPGQVTSSGPAGGTRPEQVDARRVFVVSGRDRQALRSFSELLRSVDLRPLPWEASVRATRTTSPYLGQVVSRAPHIVQAILVLLTPDDIVELHSDLYLDGDSGEDHARTGQARPNVLFELGQALMACPERTIVVEVGRMRPFTDMAGLNVIRFDGSPLAIRKVLSRLEQAGCPVDWSDEDWVDPSRFAGLAAYERGPGTHDDR